MIVTPTSLPEVLLIEPKIFGDDRGFFYESYNADRFQQATNVHATFVQDNHSKSRRGVLRGLHYQVNHPQGKLVRVTRGRVFDVAVDIRRSSPRFGQWAGVMLDDQNKHQLWIPPGFAHGFLVVSDEAEFLYKTTDYWFPEHERSIVWNDPTLNIQWPAGEPPLLAAKDAGAPRFESAEVFV